MRRHTRRGVAAALTQERRVPGNRNDAPNLVRRPERRAKGA
ncbi:hypothetical protein OH687_27825 [Burkholderia anthina]|nr:hypothetical protein OH687_27825 [Burkholderia anthina]